MDETISSSKPQLIQIEPPCTAVIRCVRPAGHDADPESFHAFGGTAEIAPSEHDETHVMDMELVRRELAHAKEIISSNELLNKALRDRLARVERAAKFYREHSVKTDAYGESWGNRLDDMLREDR